MRHRRGDTTWRSLLFIRDPRFATSFLLVVALTLIGIFGFHFFDLVTGTKDGRMSVAEVTVGEGSFCDGMSSVEANIAGRFGVTVLGVVSADGTLDLHPAGERRLVSGDTLLALGEEAAIEDPAAAAGR